MFCAFSGAPKILRLQGLGEVLEPDHTDFADLRPLFGEHLGVRSIIRVHVRRIADACGYSVPRYDFVAERNQLTKWAENRGEAGLQKYRDERNQRSIEGLAGLAPREL
jgi:hypothetical protein